MKASIFIYALTLATLAGCGHKDDAPAAATSPVVTPNGVSDYQGGRCADHVVNDYIAVARACRATRFEADRRDPGRDGDRREFEGCRKLGDAFLANYPQADCTMSIAAGPDAPSRDRQLQERDVRALMGAERR